MELKMREQIGDALRPSEGAEQVAKWFREEQERCRDQVINGPLNEYEEESDFVLANRAFMVSDGWLSAIEDADDAMKGSGLIDRLRSLTNLREQAVADDIDAEPEHVIAIGMEFEAELRELYAELGAVVRLFRPGEQVGVSEDQFADMHNRVVTGSPDGDDDESD